MYDLIYDYIITYLLDNSQLASMQTTLFGQTIAFNQYLAHFATIIFIGVIMFLLCMFVKWIFKLFSGLWNR